MDTRHLRLCCTGLHIAMAMMTLFSGSCADKTLSKRDRPHSLPTSIAWWGLRQVDSGFESINPRHEKAAFSDFNLHKWCEGRAQTSIQHNEIKRKINKPCLMCSLLCPIIFCDHIYLNLLVLYKKSKKSLTWFGSVTRIRTGTEKNLFQENCSHFSLCIFYLIFHYDTAWMVGE